MTSLSNDPRSVVILGSTGSIGTQAIDVIQRNRARFRVRALSAGGGNLSLLAAQALDLEVEQVGLADSGAVEDFRAALRDEAAKRGLKSGDFKLPDLLHGPEASTELAALPCDSVLNGITGSVGLEPTLAALKSGSRLILANKESLIVGGPLVKKVAAPGQILPVDSEHSALFQCLQGGKEQDVRKLVVTASGGPFHGRGRAEMAAVTPEQALAHPVWNMGPVITINCANLVNKGLEVIEAHLLFDIPFSRIEVVVHPQVMVHSMVEFTDGSTLAQVSPPDIRLPLSLGLGWPDRVPDAAPSCDWTKASTWEFFPVDGDAFPGVQLAYEVGEAGGTVPAVFNAANEELVAAFVAGRLPFLGIVDTLGKIVGEHDRVPNEAMTLEAIAEADRWARARAKELVGLSD
ncbi:1-deoxy-D-xylulose-5-phosphate reductoisomerase [Streptomyces rubellomurinus]|uniref:1-deoxy-D-xylulose 5-phosphate reductoisomerase n=2 Tax=Streptomyces TaxID=1883 RepID=A0A0F2TE98_STRR3|nr:1-deoxy-D-xylulose-5-phosphate reductoisomerase [Streptomyces rubellomurinus]KJS53890.1 1-deoxy-D-xylulose 5-phosphate reductoisomerase [Streptomyces rubellomurinus subsp. indigoferus]KJS60092.1 1-deoxy-D-xylulose 5-phosphate reductoisomerase [Streptomyces rubellomurinus]